MFSKCSRFSSPFYGQIFKLGFDLDLFLTNALIPDFENSGFMESARQGFDENPLKDTLDCINQCCRGRHEDNCRGCAEGGYPRSLFVSCKLVLFTKFKSPQETLFNICNKRLICFLKNIFIKEEYEGSFYSCYNTMVEYGYFDLYFIFINY